MFQDITKTTYAINAAKIWGMGAKNLSYALIAD